MQISNETRSLATIVVKETPKLIPKSLHFCAVRNFINIIWWLFRSYSYFERRQSSAIVAFQWKPRYLNNMEKKTLNHSLFGFWLLFS